MTDQPGGLSIGQVAERAGLSVHALRFYEREGVFLSPIRRAAGGRRVFTEVQDRGLRGHPRGRHRARRG